MTDNEVIPQLAGHIRRNDNVQSTRLQLRNAPIREHENDYMQTEQNEMIPHMQ